MPYLLIGVAGAAGALLRYGVGVGLQHAAGDGFPYGTLAANCIGCFLLAWLNGWAQEGFVLSPLLKNAFGSGLIGSFTTFSTFSVETVDMVSTGRTGAALLYVLASIWGGFLFAWAGWRLAARQFRIREAGDR